MYYKIYPCSTVRWLTLLKKIRRVAKQTGMKIVGITCEGTGQEVAWYQPYAPHNNLRFVSYVADITTIITLEKVHVKTLSRGKEEK